MKSSNLGEKMRFIGRHATETELADMRAPFKTNTGKVWTRQLIGECINKGADVVDGNQETQQALEDGVKLLPHADRQGK